MKLLLKPRFLKGYVTNFKFQELQLTLNGNSFRQSSLLDIVETWVCKIQQKGSHVIMQKIIDQSTITVPVPLYKEIKTGTLHSKIRQSGLARHDFE